MKSKWLLRPVDSKFASRLFCFPYSGSGASMYRRWPTNIGAVEICPLQFPGRENRLAEPHYGCYETLAEQLVAALPPYLDRPYAFFGHCGGVLPAFEAALRLVEHGFPAPSHFFASSQVAPHQGPFGRFLYLEPHELAGELSAFLRSLDDSEPSSDMIDLMLEILTADLAANRKYRIPDPVRFPCPITVLGWTQDREVPTHLLSGWKEYGDVEIRTLEGEHTSFLTAPDNLIAEFRRVRIA